MSGFLFGGKNIGRSVRDDIKSIFGQRTGNRPSVYEDGDIFLLSARDITEYKGILVVFEGYLLGSGNKPEKDIAKAYKRYGPGFAEHIDGAFRTIIYDKEKERFYASSDRAGRKVLYYSSKDGKFLCSSHLTPLLRDPSIKAEISPLGVSDFLMSWSVSFAGGERLIDGVHQVYPSHYLTYKSGSIDQQWFWDIRRNKRNISDKKAVEKMDELLTEGAERILEQSSSPLNVFLSGGFDSTFLVALLRELTDEQINTYTWGWKDNHFKDGRRMADKYNTNHNEIRNNYDLPSDEELHFYEEPQNAFVRYPFYELYHEHGVRSYWTGLNSQATFPVCLKNIRTLDRTNFISGLLKSAPTEKLKSISGSKINYKISKAIEILESDNLSTGVVVDWGINRKDARDLVSENLAKNRNIEKFIDRKWNLSEGSYQENYNYLQLRLRDTARYAYYAQDFNHYDVYGYLPLLEYSYSLPMSQKKNRRLLQKVAKGRVPDRIITKGASGWEFVSEQFRQKIIHNEDDYRRNINRFIDRGLVNPDAAQRILLPEKFPQGRGKINQMIAVYLLERWLKIFVDRPEPWKPVK